MTLEDSLRWSGLVLQIGGYALAALGIASTRSRYTTLPSTFARAGRWVAGTWRRWMRKLFRRPQTLAVAAGIHATGSVGQPRLIQTSPPLPVDSDLETRLVELDRLFRHLEQRHNDSEARIDEQIRDLGRRIDDEIKDRREGDEAAAALAREVAADGLGLQAVGLSLFALGVVLATVPSELADLVHGVSPW